MSPHKKREIVVSDWGKELLKRLEPLNVPNLLLPSFPAFDIGSRLIASFELQVGSMIIEKWETCEKCHKMVGSNNFVFSDCDNCLDVYNRLNKITTVVNRACYKMLHFCRLFYFRIK